MINEFLNNCFSPEKRDIMIDALEAMTDFNVFDVPNTIENMLTDPNLGNFEKISESYSMVRSSLLDILNAHTIVCNDGNIRIDLLTNMVKALHLVANEYDPAYIKASIDFELTDTNEAIDVYVAIVTLLTNADEHDVYEAIWSVDDVIITNIFNFISSKEITLPPDDNSIYVTRYRQYLKGRRTGVVYELVRGSVGIGTYEFNDLFTLVMDGLDKLKREELVYELNSLILVSDADFDEFNELMIRASKLMTITESEAKMLHQELRNDYITQTGNQL